MKEKKQNENLSFYCHIYANNKYATQMPNLCHMTKLLSVHQWEMYVNIYVLYELTGISHVTRSAAHRQQ